MVKAIETRYKGYRFRSRLEARWAVFFDALGVQWDYEIEGFELGIAGRYLPDFYLPQIGTYVEIKPETGLSTEDRIKIEAFKRLIGRNNFTLLSGVPVSFRDDDRNARFDSHLNQMILVSRLSVTLAPTFADRGQGKFSIDDIRAASFAARSARFEHGESPNV